jgi:hypothetical protein
MQQLSCIAVLLFVVVAFDAEPIVITSTAEA